MTTGSKIDLIRTIASYHEDLARSRSTIEQIRTLASQHRYEEVLTTLNEFLNRHLIPHFEFEELIVFHAIRKSEPPLFIIDLLDRCISEHSSLRSDIKELIAVMSASVSQTPSDGAEKTVYTLADLHTRILSHAAREDAVLIPYVHSHEEIRFLMGHRFLEYRSGYETRFAPEMRLVPDNKSI